MFISLGRKKVVRGIYFGVDNVISRVVVDYYFWFGVGVVRIYVVSSLGLVFLGCNWLVVCVGVVLVGDGVGVEVFSRDVCIGVGSFEDIRICCSKNVGYYGVWVEFGEEDMVFVGVVVFNGLVYYVDNGMVVGVVVVGVSSVRRDILVVIWVWWFRVYDNEVVSIG